MTTKLQVYNAALLLCGERKIANLTENREPRRLLDEVWDNGGVKTCLEAGYWNFGTRSFKIENDPSVDPGFGFEYGFEKPSDWCRTAVVSADEYFRSPMTDREFSDEAGYWFSDLDVLYVKMVSDGASYGGDLSSWPESFARYVDAYFAHRIAPKLTRSQKFFEAISDQMKSNLKGSTAKDAQDSGSSVMPEGSWNRARHSSSRGSARRDGGSRRSLVG